jgi:hypothetical protein
MQAYYLATVASSIAALNGCRYEGEIRDGKADGQGTWTSDEGMYVGEFKNGRMNGQGTMTKSNGTTQSGLWDKGQYLGPSPAPTNAPPTSGTDKKS